MTVRELIQAFMFGAMDGDLHLHEVCVQDGERYIPLKGFEIVRVQKDNAGVFFPADKYDNIGVDPVNIVVVREVGYGAKDRTEN
jgi:hypothetical protein